MARLIVAWTAGSAAVGVLIGSAARAVSGNRMAPWIIGRAGGITAYLLLVAVVVQGLTLAHPWRARLAGREPPERIHRHAVLALLALAFTVLHVVVLATDRYAHVGWWGAALPMASDYRPVPVTLGVLGAWSALLSATTAAFAAGAARRIWWPLHKLAVVALPLVWVHGVLAGADPAALRGIYIGTGLLVVLVAISRYAARTAADRRRELVR